MMKTSGMNQNIVDILRISKSPVAQCAAQRIEELEAERDRLKARAEAMEKLINKINSCDACFFGPCRPPPCDPRFDQLKLVHWNNYNYYFQPIYDRLDKDPDLLTANKYWNEIALIHDRLAAELAERELIGMDGQNDQADN